MRRPDQILDAAAVSDSTSDTPTITGGEMAAGSARGHAHDEDLAAGTLVGRYLVIARVAAGGMGVVYLAYDPELDRRVALKLLDRATSAENRTAALSEAQALARLSHHNVVTVHDVGTYVDRVWLAMEFVEGLTLTQWSKAEARSWREALDVLIAAGDGLAAAHAVNLAHRDFKPDNVMVSRTERVLVTDFGLARHFGDEAAAPRTDPSAPGPDLLRTPVRGTPAYMAPERHSAGTGDARIDQFGFCVTLWEALYGERPFTADNVGALVVAVTRGEIRAPPASRRVPRWLRRAVERGLDADPERRWPSMVALLQHLRDGKMRTRRRWIAAALGGTAVLALGAWQVDRLQDRRARQECVDEGASIERTWPGANDEIRTQMRDAFAATEVVSAVATFDRAAARLDTWTSAWSERATAECTAALGGRDATLHAAATACLEGQRDGLTALIETLGEPDREVVRRAVVTTAGLARPELCADDADLLRRPLPAAETAEHVAEVRRILERGRSQRLAGRYPLARTTTDAVLADARAIGWLPLIAAALLESGRVHDKAGEDAAAVAVLQDAYLIALAADDPDTAVDAAILLVRMVGVGLARRDDGTLWALHAGALLQRMGQTETLRAAQLAISRAMVHRSAAAYDEAVADIEHAIALRRAALGDEHPDVAAALNNLGNVYWERGDHAEAKRLFERALPIWEASIGPDHPDTAMTILNLGNTMWASGDFDGAERQYARALTIRRGALGPDHPDVAQNLLNLGAVDHMRGRYAAAIVRYEEAIGILRRARVTEHPELVMVLINLATSHGAMGSFAEAERVFAEGVAMSARVNGPDHPRHANTLRQRGEYHFDRGTDAIADLEAARTILQPDGDNDELAGTLALIAMAVSGAGDGARGEQLCAEATAMSTRLHGPAAADWPAGSICLAHAYLARGRFVDAAVAAERAIAISVDVGTPSDRIAPIHLLLAEAFWGTGDRSRAGKAAQRAHEDALGEERRERVATWLRAHPAE